MNDAHLGMVLAFSASLFWTFAPVFFAAAARRIGAFNLNVLRLALAGALLCAIGTAYAAIFHGFGIFVVPGRGLALLMLSGFSGLVIGDLFYLKSLTMLGPRRTTQFFTLGPVFTVLAAWIILGERLSLHVLLGIGLILGGIIFILFHEQTDRTGTSAEPGTFSLSGTVMAIVAVLFHGIGALLARWAFIEAPDLDPVAATTIRIGCAGAILTVYALLNDKLVPSLKCLNAPGVMSRLTAGVLAGPVIGMLFYVAAFKYAEAGIVTTLSGFSPVLILPVIAIRYRVKIKRESIIGAVVTIIGAAVMGIGR